MKVTDALCPLLHLPLWGATCVGDMAIFHFGEKLRSISKLGREAIVGGYSIHLQCPWRIVGLDGIIVGSGDMCIASENGGHSRFMDVVSAWTPSFLDGWKVDSVNGDPIGGFRLGMSGHAVLESFPAHSMRGEFSEHWRLLRPSLGADDFVVDGETQAS